MGAAGSAIVQPITRQWLTCRIAVAAWLLALPAWAIDPAVRLDQLHRTDFTRLQDAPADLSLIAQTQDGMLWLEGAGGLYRFDGLRFERFVPGGGDALSTANITALHGDASGGLWVVYADETVDRIADGGVVHQPALPADHSSRVKVLTTDAQGHAWAAAKSGLYRLSDGRWRRLGDEVGIAGTQVDDVAMAGNGAVWVATDAGVFRLDAGVTQFKTIQSYAVGSIMAGLVVGSDDSVWHWTGGSDGRFCRLRPVPQQGCWTATSPLKPVLDAHGALWWISPTGSWRLADPAALSADPADLQRHAESFEGMARSLLPSVDGSVWTSGASGLSRLRQTPLRRARTPTGALARGTDGQMWLASFSRGLMRIGVPGAAQGAGLAEGMDHSLWTAQAVRASVTIKDGMTFQPFNGRLDPTEPVVLQRYPEAGLTSVRVDTDAQGRVWLGTLSPAALLRLDGARFTPVPLPELERGAVLRGVRADSAGNLWLGASLAQVALQRRVDNVWQPDGGAPDARPLALTSFTVDAQDRVWVAFGVDTVSVLEQGRWRHFSAADGLALGETITVQVAAGQVWVSGQRGLAIHSNGRFLPVIGAGEERFLGCGGIELLDDGDVWLNCAEGIFRIQRAQWKQVLADAGHRVVHTRFDQHDGLNTSAIRSGPLPSIARGSDGRLWFAGVTGLFWIDPATVEPPLPAPTAGFRSLHADDVAYAPLSAPAFAAGTRRVVISFLAPPIDYPERTRFQYRLVGDHGGWIAAGTRREVLYSDLPPGRHAFEVVASDRDGNFAQKPTRLEFSILPAFQQTFWFKAVVVLGLLLLMATFYLLRVRQLSQRIRRESSARLGERMRIARDLHDTLLQSVQGLLMHLQAIAARMAQDDPLRQRLEQLHARAQTTLSEGRDRVGALRDPRMAATSLIESLQQHALTLAQNSGVLCEVLLPSVPRPLLPVAHEELLRIGSEALSNAFQHARASKVSLELDCAAHALTMRVRDDGIGIDAALLDGGGRDGHYGLRGIRERASVIGADLRVRACADGGTEVTVRLLALRAYPPAGADGAARGLRLAGGRPRSTEH